MSYKDIHTKTYNAMKSLIRYLSYLQIFDILNLKYLDVY